MHILSYLRTTCCVGISGPAGHPFLLPRQSSTIRCELRAGWRSKGSSSGQQGASPRMQSMRARNKKSATSGAKTASRSRKRRGRRAAGVQSQGPCAGREGAEERRLPNQANRLPLLPLRSDVVFPQTVVPLVINRPSGIRLIDDVLIGERLVGLVSQLHPEIDEPALGGPLPDDLRGHGPQDAEVPGRLDPDRLPGADPGPAGREWSRPSPT